VLSLYPPLSKKKKKERDPGNGWHRKGGGGSGSGGSGRPKAGATWLYSTLQTLPLAISIVALVIVGYLLQDHCQGQEGGGLAREGGEGGAMGRWEYIKGNGTEGGGRWENIWEEGNEGGRWEYIRERGEGRGEMGVCQGRGPCF